MSLREDAIRAYQEKKEAKEAEQAESKRKSVEERIAEVRERICKAFALAECPPLAVTQCEAEYWPEVEFEVEGMAFRCDLGRSRIELKVACPKCGYEGRKSILTKSAEGGALDLSDLGYELCWSERHDCPADKPPYVPPPPPQTIAYRVDSVEVRLLDAIREYVDDRIEERMGDR